MIQFNEDVKNTIMEAAEILYKSVGSTLGPNGKNVILPNGLITKDGVTVAKYVHSHKPEVQKVIEIIRNVAIKTGDDAGDGTTTSIILTYHILKEGFDFLENRIDYSVTELRNALLDECQKAVTFIKEQSIPVEDKLKEIALISSNGDEVVSNLIVEAFDKVGKNGIITIEESKSMKSYVHSVNGVFYNDRGYLSPFFVTDPVTEECVFENPQIVLCEGKVTALNDSLVKVLENAMKKNIPVLLIADEFDSNVIDTLIMNKAQRGLKVCCITSPSYGKFRKDYIEDLALLIGGGLGSADKVIITKETTTIVNGHGNKEFIKERAATLDLNDNIQKDRYIKLTASAAIIYIGATTELEMKEIKDRADDALCATQSALEEGIVPGGGYIYKQYANNWCENPVLKETLQAPMEKLKLNKNSIINDAEVYNAVTDSLEDPKETKILDPAKVTRVALENAVSIASTLLTTNTLIVNG